MKDLYKVLLLLVALAGFPTTSYGQDFTTIILFRHAEKEEDGTSDPSLSEAGRLRANRLAYILYSQPIEMIYTTKYSRNTSTIYPIASDKAVVTKIYDPSAEGFIEMLLKNHPGKTVLVCGHSNTVPKMVNKLLGKELLNDLDEKDYNDLFIVTVTEMGKGKLTVINY